MNFIELTGDKGKYLFDFDSGWEIHDENGLAVFVNHKENASLQPKETYADILYRLTVSNPMLRSVRPAP